MKSVNGLLSLKKPTSTHVVYSFRFVCLLLAASLIVAGCASAPWYVRASDHFGLTYQTREHANDVDVFVGPNFNLYGPYDLESVWVGLQKVADASVVQLKVETKLKNSDGLPFQQAQSTGKSLNLLHLVLMKFDAMTEDLTSVEVTVERFVISVPVSLASAAACDDKDLVIKLSGKGREVFDLSLPRAMLQGFLGKVKKSGEEGIEGQCFDQFL